MWRGSLRNRSDRQSYYANAMAISVYQRGCAAT